MRGITLIEMSIVVAGIAILASLAIPTVQVFQRSVESPGAIKGMVSGALAAARAIAAKEQNYTGVRFQWDGDRQNMVFVLRDKDFDSPFVDGEIPALAFSPLPDKQPMSIPRSSLILSVNGGITTEEQLDNAASFAILFSPAGKCIIKRFRIVADATADEYSQNQFLLIPRKDFNYAFSTGTTGAEYFADIPKTFINSYTGTIIESSH